jgi:hypothetical protein
MLTGDHLEFVLLITPFRPTFVNNSRVMRCCFIYETVLNARLLSIPDETFVLNGRFLVYLHGYSLLFPPIAVPLCETACLYNNNRPSNNCA